jgi:hypothetical protein
MASWKRNCEVNSGVVINQLVIWIDPDLQQDDDKNLTYA